MIPRMTSAKGTFLIKIDIFKQIEKRILSAYESAKSGCPSLIVIDEAWLALSNPIFAGKIKEWLKVLRRS